MAQATHLFVKYHNKKKIDSRVIDAPMEFEYIRGRRYIKQPKEYKVKPIAVDDIISVHFCDLSY